MYFQWAISTKSVQSLLIKKQTNDNFENYMDLPNNSNQWKETV